MTLDDFAAEEQDPGLFPREVKALYESGRILDAHAALMKHLPAERDRSRAQQQQQALDRVDIWIQPLGPGEYPRLAMGRTVVLSLAHGEAWIVTTASVFGTGAASWLCTGPHLQGCSAQVPGSDRGARSARRGRRRWAVGAGAHGWDPGSLARHDPRLRRRARHRGLRRRNRDPLLDPVAGVGTEPDRGESQRAGGALPRTGLVQPQLESDSSGGRLRRR